jgi:hypothetical protein
LHDDGVIDRPKLRHGKEWIFVDLKLQVSIELISKLRQGVVTVIQPSADARCFEVFELLILRAVDAVRVYGAVREIQHRWLASGDMPFDLLDGTALIVRCFRSDSGPEDPNQEVALSEDLFVEYLLRVLTHRG